MRLIPLIVLIALAGCAARMETKWFNDELQHFVGKNLTDITKYIGPPDTKLDVQGSTVYTWTPQPYDCKLHLTTDSDGMILAYSWEGDASDVKHGCYHFSSALDLH